LLEAIARDALGDSPASVAALKHALDLAEPHHDVLPFLLHPAPALLERHSLHRTTHASLISEILALLAARTREPRSSGPEPLREPLTEAETRILRYLPTHLPASEISAEMFVSVSTVRTHMRNLYAKLGAHRRGEAVARARALGLLAPSSRRDPG
jgi:LuxR family transcriptional regulator, maltose regulon positive regulatory protein